MCCSAVCGASGSTWCAHLSARLQRHLPREAFREDASKQLPTFSSFLPQPFAHYLFQLLLLWVGTQRAREEISLSGPFTTWCQGPSWCFEIEPTSILTKRFAATRMMAVRNIKNTLNWNHGTPHLQAVAPRSLPRGLY